VLRQSHSNIEIQVIDDASSDGSAELLLNLRKRKSFDLYFHKDNIGPSCTFNEALARARGEFIVPFGSDDVMMPWRVEHQIAHMIDKPEVGICAGNIETIDDRGRVLQKQRRRDLPFRRLNFDDLFLSKKPGPPAPTLMIRKDILLEVGGFNQRIRLEDLYIELAVTRKGYFIDVLGEVLAQYRIHPTNTCKNKRFMVNSVLETYACFSDHPDYAKACAHYRNSMLLKYARRDKALAREILADLPFRAWNMKTLRGIWRLPQPLEE
jgi:alpha-1,3-rhamnosyltransferase